MPTLATLRPHPRLFLPPESTARLRTPPTLPLLMQASMQVRSAARRHVKLPPLQYTVHTHNGLLLRARQMQDRVFALLAEWLRTGEARFRTAIVACIREMRSWEYWSWIAWREGNSAPDAIFDLSYGENALTLAVAYDWLYDMLTEEEGELFLDTAHHWAFAAGLKHCRPGGAWWFGKTNSNWNTVCAGGLGTLALAMYEDAIEAPELLPLVEQSFEPYMRYLDETQGAWPEGIGYWNYGMRYAFRYLLSWENATGKPHPLMKLRGTKQTLAFPLDFCPNGQPCSFGDVNHWSPEPFHYEVARRLGAHDVLAALDTENDRIAYSAGRVGYAPEWLALHPGEPDEILSPQRTQRTRRGKGKSSSSLRDLGDLRGEKAPVVRLYKGLDWAVLADRLPSPSLYLAVRGGSTKVPHGHRDLLSVHCVVGSDHLLADVKNAEYLDTTFSPRREELYEISPAAKNTILINGVGVASGSQLNATRKVTVAGCEGILLDASNAWGPMSHSAGVKFCGRLVLMLGTDGFLIVDRVSLAAAGRAESRMHTLFPVKTTKSSAVLRGKHNSLRMTYAATVPSVLLTATSAPTTPTAPQATVLRWCTATRLQSEITLATLLTPTTATAKLALEEAKGRITVTASGKGWERVITLTDRLKGARGKVRG